MRKVYIASSWRNAYYTEALEAFRAAGFICWDWRSPPTGGNGFSWSACDVHEYGPGNEVSASVWRKLLASAPAQSGFASDLCGMNWCDVGILLHPCGRSAHLEAGWLAGRGKIVHVICPEPVQPDLMVLALNGKIFSSIPEAVISMLAEKA